LLVRLREALGVGSSAVGGVRANGAWGRGFMDTVVGKGIHGVGGPRRSEVRVRVRLGLGLG